MHNETRPNGWLQVQLRDAGGGDAVGTLLTLIGSERGKGDVVQLRCQCGGAHSVAQDEQLVHFGTGESTAASCSAVEPSCLSAFEGASSLRPSQGSCSRSFEPVSGSTRHSAGQATSLACAAGLIWGVGCDAGKLEVLELHVLWLSGRRHSYTNLSSNQRLWIDEKQGLLRREQGRARRAPRR